MLHSYILSRYHLTVEHHFFSAVFLVIVLHNTENRLHEMQIVRIVVYLQPEELSGFHQTVHTDSKILTAHVYVSRIEERQHLMLLQLFQIFIISKLNLMTQIHYLCQELLIIHLIVDSILYATVQIYRKHTLRTSRDASCSKSITESVVLYLITQTATRTE